VQRGGVSTLEDPGPSAIVTCISSFLPQTLVPPVFSFSVIFHARSKPSWQNRLAIR